MNWKTYERLRRHTIELEFRKIFEEDIRRKWKTYERLGRHTNELGLGFRKIFFRKTYEGSGRHTNELGFRFFFLRKTYE